MNIQETSDLLKLLDRIAFNLELISDSINFLTDAIERKHPTNRDTKEENT